MRIGRTGRIVSSALLALASAFTFASAAAAAAGGGTTGQTVCTFDANTGLTTCSVNAASLSEAGSGSTSYWHFVLNSVPDNVVPSALEVCWGSYCLTQPPWVIPPDNSGLCHTDVAGGEPCGSKNGTWHFFVPLTTQNADSDGNPIVPSSAVVFLPSDVTGSNVNFVLSEAPATGLISTTTTTEPSTTTTHPSTTTTTEPSTTTTHPSTTT
nr:hypothetical protein [Actinomycetota bacterium]